MLYGNAFEAFSSNVEVLAMLNNLIAGRRFDEFEKLTLDAYSRQILNLTDSELAVRPTAP